MRARGMEISADLWMEILKSGKEQHFRVIKNGLPEDARCVGIEMVRGSMGCLVFRLLIESSVFQDSDPPDLPDVTIQSLYPKKGEYVPYSEAI